MERLMTSPSSAASGMSKREHFAGLALMGIVGPLNGDYPDCTFAAEVSVRYANALIERLNMEADFDDQSRNATPQ
jgi:hypothetical protein